MQNIGEKIYTYRNRIAIILMLIVFTWIGSVAIKYPVQMKNMFVTSSIGIMEKNMEDSVSYINENVLLNYDELRLISKIAENNLDGSENYSKQLLDVLEEARKEGGYEQIGIIKLDSGYPLAITSDGTQVEVDIRVIATDLKEGQVMVDYQTSPFRSKDTGNDAVVFRTMITDKLNEKYVIIAEKSRDALNSILNLKEDSEQGKATFVMKNNGNVVYGKGMIDDEEFTSYNFYSFLTKIGVDNKTNKEVRGQINRQNYGTKRIDIDNEYYEVVFHKIKDTEWTCVNVYSETYLAGENLSMVNEKTMKLVSAVVIVMLFALILSVVLVNMAGVRQTERKVMEKERLFEEMSTHIPSAFAIVEKGKIAADFLSRNVNIVLQDAVDELDSENISKWIETELTEEDSKKILEEGKLTKTIQRKDRYYSLGIYDIGVIDEKEYYTVVFEDVTEEVISRNLLEDSMMRADEASQSKTQFLSKMSHEIRTPLNSVIGFSKLAVDGWNDLSSEDLLDYVKKIQNSGNYLLELVSDILDISRIEEGRMAVTLVPTNLDDMVEEVVSSFQGQMKRKDLQFLVDKNYDNVMLNMDSFHVKQILNNLISNAYKYTEEGGCVGFEIDAEPIDEKNMSLKFTVQDTGIGMSKEFLDKIFEPFTQDERGILMKNQLRGSGLGMSICKNLVELQNGTIEVESEEGEGSAFIVQLTYEIVGEAAERPQEQEAEVDYSFLKGKKIFVVDDIDMNRIIIAKFLEQYEILFDYATNGKEAVERFEECGEEYYAIMMDIQMPIMNGHDATRTIRKMESEYAKTIPIVAMTADAFSDDVNKALMSGMNYHVTKPVQVEKILKVLVDIQNKKEGTK